MSLEATEAVYPCIMQHSDSINFQEMPSLHTDYTHF